MSMPTEKEARQFMYDCLVYNTIDFGHEWAGWKMRGRVLVSPDGDRISAQRLRGLLFQEANRVRQVKRKDPTLAELVRLPLRATL